MRCIVCKAGIAEAQPFEVRPGSDSGHHQRHIRRKLCSVGTVDCFHVFHIHGHYKRQLFCSMQSATALPIHEFVTETMVKFRHVAPPLTKAFLPLVGSTPLSPPIRRPTLFPAVALLALEAVPHAQQDSVIASGSNVWSQGCAP